MTTEIEVTENSARKAYFASGGVCRMAITGRPGLLGCEEVEIDEPDARRAPPCG